MRAIGRPGGFEELATCLAECRLTLTTSYHVALVSLYVGTPVIALYESEYYRLKFTGLAQVLDTPLLRVVSAEEFGQLSIEKTAGAATQDAIDALRDTLVSLREVHAEARGPIAHALERRA